MDVEQNPGPVQHNPNEDLQSNLDSLITKITQHVSTQSASLYSKMEEHFTRLETSMSKMQENILALTKTVEQNRKDITYLKSASDNATSRLDELERETERLQTSARQSNLKFIGVPEVESENPNMMINLLSRFSSAKSWKPCDINNMYRVGQRNSQDNKPRPLIVCFRSCADKISVLRDRAFREQLRERGVKVATDLTPRQRSQLQEYRDQGLVAFFRNGRLHVENTQPVSERMSRPARPVHQPSGPTRVSQHASDDIRSREHVGAVHTRPDHQREQGREESVWGNLRPTQRRERQADSRVSSGLDEARGAGARPSTAANLNAVWSQSYGDQEDQEHPPPHSPPPPERQAFLASPTPAPSGPGPAGTAQSPRRLTSDDAAPEGRQGPAEATPGDEEATAEDDAWGRGHPASNVPERTGGEEPRSPGQRDTATPAQVPSAGSSAVDKRNYAEVARSPPRVDNNRGKEGNPRPTSPGQQRGSPRGPRSARDSRSQTTSRNSSSPPAHSGQDSARRQTRSKSQSQAGKQSSLPASWRQGACQSSDQQQ